MSLIRSSLGRWGCCSCSCSCWFRLQWWDGEQRLVFDDDDDKSIIEWRNAMNRSKRCVILQSHILCQQLSICSINRSSRWMQCPNYSHIIIICSDNISADTVFGSIHCIGPGHIVRNINMVGEDYYTGGERGASAVGQPDWICSHHSYNRSI